MFRSQIDHHQGCTIFLLTSVTKFYFIDCCSSMPVVMCVLGPVSSCYCCAVLGMTQDPTHTLQQACCYINQ